MAGDAAKVGAPGRVLRIVLIAHGAVTLAAAVVLAVAPGAIPAMAGVTLARDAYLMAYLLAAAQLAVGLLSIGAARLRDRSALRLILLTFVVFHLATAALEAVYLVKVGTSPVLLANVGVRLVAAAVFAVGLRSLRETART